VTEADPNGQRLLPDCALAAFQRLATLATVVFALECALSSRTPSFVQGLRARVFFFSINFRPILVGRFNIVVHHAQSMQASSSADADSLRHRPVLAEHTHSNLRVSPPQIEYHSNMDEGRIRKIIHIDMDAFYASVEQRDNPALKGRPVAVGYPAKRGVVAAASYEARRFGVRSAMPSTTAMRKCAELVFVPPRFDVYRAVSRQIHAIFKEYTPCRAPSRRHRQSQGPPERVGNLKGLPNEWDTAKEIRARIHQETDLTASAGISCNKFLWASGLSAMSNFRIVDRDEVLAAAVGGRLAARARFGEVRGRGGAKPRLAVDDLRVSRFGLRLLSPIDAAGASDLW
jgi:hypothetical protein